MDPALAVLLALVIALIPIARIEIKGVKKSVKNLETQCYHIYDRQTIVETKLDIFLDHSGFDINKVNRTIKDNIEELKKNDRPSVGCINVKELYKEG